MNIQNIVDILNERYPNLHLEFHQTGMARMGNIFSEGKLIHSFDVTQLELDIQLFNDLPDSQLYLEKLIDALFVPHIERFNKRKILKQLKIDMPIIDLDDVNEGNPLLYASSKSKSKTGTKCEIYLYKNDIINAIKNCNNTTEMHQSLGIGLYTWTNLIRKIKVKHGDQIISLREKLRMIKPKVDLISVSKSNQQLKLRVFQTKRTNPAKSRASLMKVLTKNPHEGYTISEIRNLKYRVMKEKIFPNKCNICGFDEFRPIDFKVPLLLDHIDGNVKNFHITNIQLICYNCYFLYSYNKLSIHDDQTQIQLFKNPMIYNKYNAEYKKMLTRATEEEFNLPENFDYSEDEEFDNSE